MDRGSNIREKLTHNIKGALAEVLCISELEKQGILGALEQSEKGRDWLTIRKEKTARAMDLLQELFTTPEVLNTDFKPEKPYKVPLF